MPRNYLKADRLSKVVIGAAIEVHRIIGPGLIESIYEKCMMHELRSRQIAFTSQALIPIRYKGAIIEQNLRMDIYVEDCLVVELKAVDSTLAMHKAQVLTYMKLVDAPLGILINFNNSLLKKWSQPVDNSRRRRFRVIDRRKSIIFASFAIFC